MKIEARLYNYILFWPNAEFLKKKTRNSLLNVIDNDVDLNMKIWQNDGKSNS